MILKIALVSIAAMVLLVGSAVSVAADESNIAVSNLDAIVENHPLAADGPTDTIVASIRAGGAEVSVLVMSRNRLHHHEAQDHVLYLARGHGIARLENAAGQVEIRPIKSGDILSLPRGKKHGFAKTGTENLVFLVIATPLPHGVEETTFHE
jgi:mannose-6-phosphate isomerase-like protein (cupin superfamily)